MTRPLPDYASPSNQPNPDAPRSRQGFRLIGEVLFFEDTAIVDLNTVPGMYSSLKGRIIDLISDIEGHPSPGAALAELRGEFQRCMDLEGLE